MEIAPMPLNSLPEIMKAFKRSRVTVLYWFNLGAPIVCEGEGPSRRYLTEYNRLLDWLLKNSEKLSTL